MKLENKADVLIPEGRQLVLLKTCDFCSIDGNIALIIGIHGRKEVKQGGFARTGFTHDGYKLSFVDFEGYVFEDMEFHGFVEVFIDMIYR